jgi:hypothetical protein
MTYRTRQEIFDIAYTGLAKQGWKKSSANGICAYRGRRKLKCAIGHCIDDDDYKLSFEGEMRCDVSEAARISGYDSGWARVLQLRHENSLNAKDMKRRFDDFASECNLTIPQVQS